jgi:uncharacterized membrane protein YjjP (DUF1212 family)
VTTPSLTSSSRGSDRARGVMGTSVRVRRCHSLSAVLAISALFVVVDPGSLASAQQLEYPARRAPVETTSTTSTSSTSSTSTSSTSSTSTTLATTSTTLATSTTTAIGARPEEPTTSPATTAAPATRPAIPAAAGKTEVPVGSLLIAAGVLTLMGVLVGLAVRRRPAARPVPGTRPTGSPLVATGGDLRENTFPSGESATVGGRRVTLQFMVAAGGALIDAGDPADDVDRRVSRIARVNGVADAGIVVLPNALMVSLPGERQVQTEVRAAGRVRLQLGQIDEVFRIVEEAERGELSPAAGLVALAEARRMPPLRSPLLRLLGALLMAAGLVPVLGGSWVDLLVAAALGVGMGAFQMAAERRADAVREVQAFVPLVGSFVVAAAVFALGRLIDDLSAFVPLVAPLATLLPGGLLTTAVLEVSSGQLVSGAGRFASGLLQLSLLAIGIVAGAQLVGVPASSITAPVSDPIGVVLAWLGVAVFGTGVFLFHGSRRTSLPWMLVVLYAAYAGQIVGGVFFGGVLSAFFGALTMTPAAMLASRPSSGPPMLVSFLPGFWLLVPGALGLVGVTKFLGGQHLAGIDVLATTLATMLAIALGILLGTAIGTRLPERIPWVGSTDD